MTRPRCGDNSARRGAANVACPRVTGAMTGPEPTYVLSGQVRTRVDGPVVGADDPVGEGHIALLQQREPQGTADPVRRQVRDAGKGVHDTPAVFIAGALQQRANGRLGQTASLELG